MFKTSHLTASNGEGMTFYLYQEIVELCINSVAICQSPVNGETWSRHEDILTSRSHRRYAEIQSMRATTAQYDILHNQKKMT